MKLRNLLGATVALVASLASLPTYAYVTRVDAPIDCGGGGGTSWGNETTVNPATLSFNPGTTAGPVTACTPIDVSSTVQGSADYQFSTAIMYGWGGAQVIDYRLATNAVNATAGIAGFTEWQFNYPGSGTCLATTASLTVGATTYKFTGAGAVGLCGAESTNDFIFNGTTLVGHMDTGGGGVTLPQLQSGLPPGWSTSTPVPEPDLFILLALAVPAMLIARRKRAA